MGAFKTNTWYQSPSHVALHVVYPLFKPVRLAPCMLEANVSFDPVVFALPNQPRWFLKTLDKFFSFEVEIVDDTKRYRYLDIR